MSTRPDPEWMLEWRRAIAAEVRARMARKRIDETDLARQMGLTQSYLNRRRNGVVPFTVEELLKICDLMDEDFASVVASAKAAAATNPCLSRSENPFAEGCGIWELRGYELAWEHYGMRYGDPVAGEVYARTA